MQDETQLTAISMLEVIKMSLLTKIFLNSILAKMARKICKQNIACLILDLNERQLLYCYIDNKVTQVPSI